MEMLQYLALGDSYTVGEGVNPGETWPLQLAEMLRSHKNQEITVTKIAATGWTTDDLLQAMTERLSDNATFSFASVLVGVNNQYRGGDIAVYRTELAEILTRAVNLAQGRVFCFSIPDWSVTPFGLAEGRTGMGDEIDSFNDIVRRLCDQFHLPFVDITAVSRIVRTEQGMMAEDGLHYSGKMYRIWAEKALSFVLPFV